MGRGSTGLLAVWLLIAGCSDERGGGHRGRDAGAGVDSGGSGDHDAGMTATCSPAPEGVSVNAAAALRRENEVRTLMGIPCARMDPAINVGADAHCRYYLANAGNGACTGNPHVEVEGCEQFYAANFWERMAMGGYGGGAAAEDMNFVGSGASAVQGWIDSVWHRTPVLSPWVRDIGYGGGPGCDTQDFGGGEPADENIVATYPYDGQPDVPTSFDGRFEGPSPPAPPTGWPSGYPVHVYLRGLVMLHQIMRDDDGVPIDHVYLQPGTPESLGLLQNEVVLYTYAPLDPGTRYRVHVTGNNGAGPVDRDWTFTTE